MCSTCGDTLAVVKLQFHVYSVHVVWNNFRLPVMTLSVLWQKQASESPQGYKELKTFVSFIYFLCLKLEYRKNLAGTLAELAVLNIWILSPAITCMTNSDCSRSTFQ